MIKYTGKCSKCGVGIRCDINPQICRPCARVCACGASKDHRAASCQSCGMSLKAKAQWKAIRPKMMDGIMKYAREIRTRYEDINLHSTYWIARPEDGRIYTHYWDGDRKRTIYRYQWVWQQANGKIPKGYVVHHKNEIRTCDELWNLELMTRSAHGSLHGHERHMSMPLLTCPACGIEFRAKKRGPKRLRKFCSEECGRLRYQCKYPDWDKSTLTRKKAA